MLKQIITSGIIGAGLLFTVPGMAHSNHGHHNHQSITPIVKPAPRHCVSGKRVSNLQNQLKRSIKQGIRKGKLVGWEITQAKRKQRKINKAAQRLRNSGHCLTRFEAKKLEKRLKRAKQKVRNLKRNNVRNYHGRHNHNRGANR